MFTRICLLNNKFVDNEKITFNSEHDMEAKNEKEFSFGEKKINWKAFAEKNRKNRKMKSEIQFWKFEMSEN